MSTHPSFGRIILNSQFQSQTATTSYAPNECVARPFHKTIDGYHITPITELHDIAKGHGVGRIIIKDESLRLGLPAYKVLGGAWAMHEAVRRKLGIKDRVIIPLAELVSLSRELSDVTVCTATDGNHGRGIAAMAEILNFNAVIFVPEDMVPERQDAIASHGARVVQIRGGYDDAVNAARKLANSTRAWLCADTAQSNESEDAIAFAKDIQNGYETIFEELIEQLGQGPDAIFIQSGVGALAASAINFFNRGRYATRVGTVEPAGSACVLESIEQGRPTQVEDTFTMMAGLRAKHVSLLAWPVLSTSIFLSASITDLEAFDSMRVLATHGITAGESGAAGLAGLLRVLTNPKVRHSIGFDQNSTIAVINTEGATDPTAYKRIISLSE